MIARRGAAAVATLVVAVAASPSACPPSAASSRGAGRGAGAGSGCGSRVTVVVDGNELGDEPRVGCADPGTAAELFADAGFPLEYQRQLQDFVCKVDGLPTDRPCTDGDSYWSLWWADPGGEWIYSTLGVGSLEVPRGGYLGFAWHEGDGDADPPDVEVGDAEVTAETPSTAAEDDSGLQPWLAGALAVLVLGVAAVVTVVRRRSG